MTAHSGNILCRRSRLRETSSCPCGHRDDRYSQDCASLKGVDVILSIISIFLSRLDKIRYRKFSQKFSQLLLNFLQTDSHRHTLCLVQ